jgi:hypothetical protein
MGKRISGNPQIAFNQGYTEGKKAGYLEGGAEAIDIARNFTVLALYNIVQDFVKSEKKQKEMLLAFCEEQNRIYGEEFYGNDDNVLLGMEGVKKIYKEIGFLQPKE